LPAKGLKQTVMLGILQFSKGSHRSEDFTDETDFFEKIKIKIRLLVSLSTFNPIS